MERGKIGYPKIVGLSANVKRPSKTYALVAQILGAIDDRYAVLSRHVDLSEALPELGLTFERDTLQGGAKMVIDAIESADALVVGAPVYKGAYSGMFRHVFDLVDPLALCNKPVILTATGGGDRHALVVEQYMRPLFGFFTANALPTAVYASARDFEGDMVTTPDTLKRIDDAVTQLEPLLRYRDHAATATPSIEEVVRFDRMTTFDHFFS